MILNFMIIIINRKLYHRRMSDNLTLKEKIELFKISKRPRKQILLPIHRFNDAIRFRNQRKTMPWILWIEDEGYHRVRGRYGKCMPKLLHFNRILTFL